MDIIFRNGLVVSDGIEQNVDLAVKDGVIKALGDLEGVEAARVIDCSGKYLLPGAVDLGVNLLGDGEFDPPSRSSFALATREALRGGVTTVITNLELGEEDSAPDEIAKQSEIDASSSYVDFGYHLAIQNWNENRAVQTRQSLNMGVCSFWVGRTGLSTPWPAPALLHAVTDHLPENALVITTPYEAVLSRYFLQKAKAIGPIEDQNWTALCPESFEAGLIVRLPQILASSRSTLLLCGLSGLEAVQALREAREKCSRLYGAVDLSHLYFNHEQRSPRLWPPIRGKSDQQALFTALEDGVASIVVSMHRPRTVPETLGHPEEGKVPPPGTASLGVFYPALHSEGVAKWRLSLGNLSVCAAADPARLAGLYPRKGTLQPGSDADIVILNPNGAAGGSKVDGDSEKMGFADMFNRVKMQGHIDQVYQRGALVLDAGTFTGHPAGQFLKRQFAVK